MDENIEVWRTLAALFHACTIVGYAQWHMSGPELEELLEQLALLNLENENTDASKGRLNGRQHSTL